MKYLFSIWLGKSIKLLSRLFRFGGTAFPGLVLSRLNQDMLSELSSKIKHGSIVVTGTNGKTTTARLISDILERAGYEVVNNSSGSNLERGLISEFLDIVSWRGEVEADIAVLEIDEADLKNVLSKVACKQLIVTNLFRDQLDRYGELESLRNLIGESIKRMPAGASLILNGDDPLVRSLGDERVAGVEVYYYGAQLDVVQEAEDSTMDIDKCIKCGGELMYEKKYYSHLGVYKCKKCDFSRPNINIFVDQYSFDINGGAKMHVMSEQWGDIWLEVDLPGKYNMYNVLTACVSACVLEVEKELIAESVSRFKPVFGRFEKVMLADGKILHLMLSKNPTGFNELLRTILDSGENLNFVFVLNDNYADGRDVSWIWDVDFEWLKERINWLAVSGMRADDMVLRMKYAGLDMDKVGKEKNIKQLVDDLEKIESKENIYVMATYTGMLEFRNVLVNKGLVKDFWRKQ